MSKIIYRPISVWPGTLSKTHVPSQFRVELPQTLRELEYELDRLDVKEAVVEIAVEEVDLRRDGTPRVKAEFAHPGVALSFDSKHGPLRYATDTYDDWRDNLRGIAKSLERLRDMDRYGVTGRGEQYKGWLQIEAASQSAAEARSFLCDVTGLSPDAGHRDETLVRAAKKATHPDRHADEDDDMVRGRWNNVLRAAETLGLS